MPAPWDFAPGSRQTAAGAGSSKRYGIMEECPSGSFPPTLATGANVVNVATPYRSAYVFGCSVSQYALGVYATSGTIQFQKITAGGGTTVNLTAAQDITATTQTAKTTFNVPLLSTLTDAQRTVMPGDMLVAVVTVTGSVTTQPVAGAATVELSVTS